MTPVPLVAGSGMPTARYDAAAPRGGVVLLGSPGSWGGGRAPRNAPPEALELDAAVRLLVSAGFTVVVPDLGWRARGREGEAADGPSDPEAIADVSAARVLLPEGRPRFVVGVGEGGLHARLAACAVLGLDGAVGFGGRIWYSGVSAQRPIQPLDLLPGLGCALQCHFAEDDPASPPAHVDELERRLANVSRPWQLFRYGVRGGAAAGWSGGAAASAWGRARSFLLHLAAERS